LKKTSVYHTVNGDRALFHTSKTAKKIKVILLRAPCQHVNVLLSGSRDVIDHVTIRFPGGHWRSIVTKSPSPAFFDSCDDFVGSRGC